MNVNTPSIVWSILFAALYAAQMYRLGRLSLHLKNQFAGSALTLWSILAYVPIIIIVLNPDEVTSLSRLVYWVRGNILIILTAVVVFAQVLIVFCRRRHIEILVRTLKTETEPSARYELAAALERYGLYDTAIAAHRRTINDSPDYCKAYVNLAALLGIRHQFDECEKLCRRAISIDANYGAAHFFLAMALTERGAIDEARTEAKTAMKLGLVGPLRMRARQILESGGHK